MNPRLALKRRIAALRRSSMVSSIHDDAGVDADPTAAWQGVQCAGEALGFGELCAHRFTQGEITRPIQLR